MPRVIGCPAPVPTREHVLLGHGSGGRLSADLLRTVILPPLRNAVLDRLEDQAEVEVEGVRLAFTTDSFVIRPLFFRGGDIGSLAVHGTVNDLAMGGAQPVAMSAALIVEEGFPIAQLRRIVDSLGRAAAAAGVAIVTGDTKVVERGAADGLFVNTSGIGVIPAGVRMMSSSPKAGDVVILSGSLGDHGIAIMAEREGLAFECPIGSDSAPLHSLVATMLEASQEVRCMRDPTRGGLSSALNEIAAQSGTGIVIDEAALTVRPAVRGACEMLGLDPLYVANEGKLVAIAPRDAAERIVSAMRGHPLGREAAVVGHVVKDHPGLVVMRTVFGNRRVVDLLSGDQLPRIC